MSGRADVTIAWFNDLFSIRLRSMNLLVRILIDRLWKMRNASDERTSRFETGYRSSFSKRGHPRWQPGVLRGIDEADFHAPAARLEFVGKEVASALDCHVRCRLKSYRNGFAKYRSPLLQSKSLASLLLSCCYPRRGKIHVGFRHGSQFSSASSLFFECLLQIFGNVISVL